MSGILKAPPKAPSMRMTPFSILTDGNLAGIIKTNINVINKKENRQSRI
jgi:hypothetical protein